VTRSLLLVALLGGYAVVGLHLLDRSTSTAFDPLEPRGRHVERAIEQRRFAEALPVALDLQRAYETEPVIAYWLSEIYRGLGRSHEEVDAWETYLRLGGAPEDRGAPADALATSEPAGAQDPNDPRIARRLQKLSPGPGGS
jgi:hypothetical protein